MASGRIGLIRREWKRFNTEFFGGKLRLPSVGVDRRAKGIYGRLNYVSSTDGRTATKLVLAEEVFSCQRLLLATLLHEMIHQYQLDVLKQDHPTKEHDAVYKSIARRAEKLYDLPVR